MMPSRKKARGKARKVAKEAKAKAKESQAAVEVEEVEASSDQRLVEEGSLAAQLQRLGINAATSSNRCVHGRPPMSHGEEKILHDFIDAFVGTYTSASGREGVMDAFITALEATKEEFAEVYSSNLEALVPALLANGTQLILNGDNKHALFNATLACFFEERRAVYVRKSKALMNLTKVYELHGADDHTLVQYFRKRIPCACLDKKYKEVKSVKKLGYCFNPNCSLPGKKAERNKMFCCTRCDMANYCSVECQKAHWKRHRDFCYRTLEAKAAFDSEQQS